MKKRPIFTVGLITLLLSWLSTTACAGELPLTAFNAEYAVTRAGFTLGGSRFSLTHEGNNRYLYESLLWPAPWLAIFHDERVEEQSAWRLEDGHIRPIEYHYQRSGGKKERKATLMFDWQQRIVENQVAGDSWRLSIPTNTLDRLSAQFALMLDLGRGEHQVSYAVADGGKLRYFDFGIIGHERLKTEIGVYDTVKVKRLNDRKRSTVLWCAPALGYLPLRIDQVEKDGARYRMDIRTLNTGGTE